MHFNVVLSENLAPENGHDMKQDYKHIWIFNGILIFFLEVIGLWLLT